MWVWVCVVVFFLLEGVHSKPDPCMSSSFWQAKTSALRTLLDGKIEELNRCRQSEQSKEHELHRLQVLSVPCPQHVP